MKILFLFALIVLSSLISINFAYAADFIAVSSIKSNSSTPYCIGYQNVPSGTNSVWSSLGDAQHNLSPSTTSMPEAFCSTTPLVGNFYFTATNNTNSPSQSNTIAVTPTITINQTPITPQDGAFTLPCSMQEKGDGVSASSCQGIYQNSIARAEVGINYHSGLFPITNYKAVGYFIDKNGNQGQNITVTLDKISPGESKTLVFTNPTTGFVSEFKMQMLGGTLVIDTDGDGISDSSDSCPTQKETVNNYQDSDGCPDVVPSTNNVVLSFNLEKNQYASDEKFTFFGKESNGNTSVFVIIRDSTGAFMGMLSDPSSDSDGTFSTLPRDVSQFFKSKGVFLATAFTDAQKEENGISMKLEYDGTKIFVASNFVLKLNSIPYQTIEEKKTLMFTATLTQSIIDAVFSLEKNPPVGATIDSKTGKFLWTPTESQGPATYVFDIVVKKGAIEDRQTLKITVTEPAIPTNPYQVTIVPTPGSGAPGCEDTLQGCYLPKSVSINVGGTIIFKNTDTAAHTFTAGSQPDGPSGEFDTSLVMAGSSYEWKPNTPGIFPYYCMVHPWMNGEIIVGGGTNTTPQPESKITVSTNKSKYNEGDTVVISGKVIGPIPEKVTIQIFNQNNLVDIAQTIVARDGSYSHTLLVQGPLWYNAGEYTLKVSFGNNISAKTLFFFNGSSDENTIPPTPDNLPYEIKITPTPGSGAPGCEETSQGCYLPKYASVATGGKVVFSNTDTAAHTWTAGTAADGPSGEFDTSLVMVGNSYEWKPTTAGQVPYYCMVHPWMEGTIFVGTSPYPIPEPEPELISLNLTIEPKVYDIGNTVSLKMNLEGVSSPHDIGIDISDVTGKTIISRSVTTSSSGAAGLDIKIAENFKAGTYRVVATTSVDGKTLKESIQFMVKSQYNQFKVTSVESTNQQGKPAPLKAGEIGFIKVNLESNKSITTLVTVNLFDSDLTSIGIGSIKTTLSSGNSEIILSFMIPKDAALGPADIYVNAFSDWPSNNGIPLTKEFAIQENIQ